MATKELGLDWARLHLARTELLSYVRSTVDIKVDTKVEIVNVRWCEDLFPFFIFANRQSSPRLGADVLSVANTGGRRFRGIYCHRISVSNEQHSVSIIRTGSAPWSKEPLLT